MKLSFQISRDYLIAHTIWYWEQERFSSLENRQDLLAFIDAIWHKHRSTYELFSNRLIPNNFVTAMQPFEALHDTLLQAERAMVDIEAMPEYKKIYDQTNNYLEQCEAQWQKNLSISEKFIEELTGFDLGRECNAIITHPSLRNGQNFGPIDGKPTFAWGTTEKWPNYITVYLWHEILHSYFDVSDISHCLIQFITDNELRIRLNGGSYPPLEGHAYLSPMMEELLPKWHEYLNSSSKDPQDFIR